jgi:histone deacetylase 11
MRLFAAIIAAGAAWLALRCVPPESFRAVKQPRPGRPAGDRVAIVYSKHYQINLGGLERLHPFDVHKYAKIYLKLQTDGLIRPADVFVPEPVTDEQMLLVHTREFLAGLNDPETVARYLEAPAVAKAPASVVDAGLLAAFRSATGGTVLAARAAVEHGIAINLAGGYHHARPDAGEGFNVYNDLAIAIRDLQAKGLIRRALVVDLDVHQGNGTAVCFAGDDDVFTFSMHQREIYPIPKAVSDLDVELPAGTGDEAYLRLLEAHLPAAIDRARPDLVLLQAGCDALAGDPLAGLTMTPEGIVRRDAVVIDQCARRGIPVAMTLGGGYGPTSWEAQYASIRRTLLTYGLAGRPGYPPRDPTAKERYYTK